jgi:hypothetical protein
MDSVLAAERERAAKRMTTTLMPLRREKLLEQAFEQQQR